MKITQEQPERLYWVLTTAFVVLAIGNFVHAEVADAMIALAFAGSCGLGATGHASRPGLLRWIAYSLAAIAVVLVIVL